MINLYPHFELHESIVVWSRLRSSWEIELKLIVDDKTHFVIVKISSLVIDVLSRFWQDLHNSRQPFFDRPEKYKSARLDPMNSSNSSTRDFIIRWSWTSLSTTSRKRWIDYMSSSMEFITVVMYVRRDETTEIHISLQNFADMLSSLIIIKVLGVPRRVKWKTDQIKFATTIQW